MSEQEEVQPLRQWLHSYPPVVQRILITGSRTWTRGTLIRVALTVPELPPTATLVHGDAQGADTLAGQIWATWLSRPVEVHGLPEKWWRRPRARQIPLERNRRMVAAGADVCLAFIRAGSGGASFTADQAQAAGIRTFRFEQEA